MSIDDVLDCGISIDDAIKNCEDVAYAHEQKAIMLETWLANDYDHIAVEEKELCRACAAEERQIAEWLKDYKELLKKTDNIERQMRTILEGDERTFSKREIEPYKDGYFDGIYECIKIFREKLKSLPTYDQVMGHIRR